MATSNTGGNWGGSLGTSGRAFAMIGAGIVALGAALACSGDAKTDNGNSSNSSSANSGGGSSSGGGSAAGGSSSNSGGNGGSSSSNGGSGGVGTSAGGGPSTGGGGSQPAICTDPQHICDEACCNVEVTCGFNGACALFDNQFGTDTVNCDDQLSQCAGACIEPASCQAIGSLATSNPDPQLSACLQACQNGGSGGNGSGGNGSGGGNGQTCFNCGINSCGQEVQACQNSAPCSNALDCAFQCNEGDGACYTQCANQNPSQATTDLFDCLNTNCATPCGL